MLSNPMQKFKTYVDRQEATPALIWLSFNLTDLTTATSYLLEQSQDWTLPRQKFLDKIYRRINDTPLVALKMRIDFTQHLSGNLIKILQVHLDNKDKKCFECEFDRLMDLGYYAALRIFMESNDTSIPEDWSVSLFRRHLHQAAGLDVLPSYYEARKTILGVANGLEGLSGTDLANAQFCINNAARKLLNKPIVDEEKMAFVLSICPILALREILKVTTYQQNQETLLHDWLRAGTSAETMRCLLDSVTPEVKGMLLSPDWNHETPFHLVVRLGSSVQMDILLRRAGPANKTAFFVCDKTMHPPLFYACLSGSRKKAKIILESSQACGLYREQFHSSGKSEYPSALHCCSDPALFSMILEATPREEMVHTLFKDKHGKNCLEYALEHEAMDDFFKILEKTPSSVKTHIKSKIILQLLEKGDYATIARIGVKSNDNVNRGSYLNKVQTCIFQCGHQVKDDYSGNAVIAEHLMGMLTSDADFTMHLIDQEDSCLVNYLLEHADAFMALETNNFASKLTLAIVLIKNKREHEAEGLVKACLQIGPQREYCLQRLLSNQVTANYVRERFKDVPSVEQTAAEEEVDPITGDPFDDPIVVPDSGTPPIILNRSTLLRFKEGEPDAEGNISYLSPYNRQIYILPKLKEETSHDE